MSTLLGVGLGACATNKSPGLATTQQDSLNTQGIKMQGITMQGIKMQGMNMQGFDIAGATLNGSPLSNVHVEQGDVVATDPVSGDELRNSDLIGAQFNAEVENPTTNPPTTQLVAYRITDVEPEDAEEWDPTHTGNTYLVSLQQQDPDDGSWQPACDADMDGRSVAIPLTDTWNDHGDRVSSSTMFTFSCTTGVIAKCYRWGYRPWLQGYGDIPTMHETCTRLARADYCGDGVSHTRDGTQVNVWDTLPAPGPIQVKAPTPLGMFFEAGWNEDGAVCLSHPRWLLNDGLVLAAECPNRLIAPGLGQTVCDSVAQALGYDATATMFNQSYLNIHLGILGLNIGGDMAVDASSGANTGGDSSTGGNVSGSGISTSSTVSTGATGS